jgi:dinuclear metal center YbgI/SA1388 family protein
MKIREIASCLEKFAPLALQETYDNSGLLIGDPESEVSAALICVDITMDILEEAIRVKADLIVSHHPLIFSGLKSLTGKTETERIVIRALKNNIAVYAIHTNLDNLDRGVNALLCEKLGIEETAILRPRHGNLNKLVTFCPDDHAVELREALFSAGAGHIGNYDSCSYNLEGFGTFRAGEDTDPFVGKQGELHTEKETRIEVIFPEYISRQLIAAMKSAHPYEEVAYDIYPLNNPNPLTGAGMIGKYKKPVEEPAFLQLLKDTLGASVIRHSKLSGRSISIVAVCGGAGSFLINDALSSGADAFVTSDLKYHQFFEAEGKMLLADAGHYETEQFTKELIYQIISEKFPTFALRISQINTNAVQYI